MQVLNIIRIVSSLQSGAPVSSGASLWFFLGPGECIFVPCTCVCTHKCVHREGGEERTLSSSSKSVWDGEWARQLRLSGH